MQTQQQSRRNDHSREKREKPKKFSRNLFIVLTILLAALAVSVVLTLNGLNVLTGPWTSILLALIAVLGAVLGTFQAFPSLLPIPKSKPQARQVFPNEILQETSQGFPPVEDNEVLRRYLATVIQENEYLEPINIPQSPQRLISFSAPLAG